MDTILITGATGYLGSLVAAGLAANGSARLVLLVRGRHDPKSVAARITREASLLTLSSADCKSPSLTVLPMPSPFNAADLVRILKPLGISEIVHCAGSLSYWDEEKLRLGNIQLTEELLDTARQLSVKRFVFLSSAFSSGYMEGIVPERLHRAEVSDPCPYTSSKRWAENIVADSGLPYLIVRPSIVIGDSRDGRYAGKLSGIYQLLWAAKRYLFGRSGVIHAVASEIPLQVIHQDSFQNGFVNAYRQLPANSIIHLVSPHEHLPTTRQLWDVVLGRHTPQCEIRYHDRISEVPLEQCDWNMRQFLSIVRTNVEISTHPWHFEAATLEHLCQNGCVCPSATLDSVAMCQERFLSAPAQRSEYCQEV